MSKFKNKNADNKKLHPDRYSSCSNGKPDPFYQMHDSMEKSKQFLALKISAREMYRRCRNQAYCDEGMQTLGNYAAEVNKSEYKAENGYFVFPEKHMNQYGLDKGNGSKLLAILEKAGFIDCVERNGHRKKINVYRFSDRWKQM